MDRTRGARAARQLVPGPVRDRLYQVRRVVERFDDVLLRLDLLTATVAAANETDGLRPVRGSAVNRHELKVFSQHGEDGILLYLFSLAGTGTRTFVEMACGDGSECLTANLARRFGWGGLLVDGDPANTALAIDAYRDRPDIEVRQAWLTVESVPELLAAAAVGADIDLLSIDVDGVDYWLWEASTVRPRVVAIEYNASFGPERSITVPYDPAFARRDHHPSGWYHGASLRALVSLGTRLGYSFVGCDSRGVNAFFVREDVQGDIPTADPARAWFPHASRSRFETTDQQFAAIAHLPFVEIPAAE